MSPNSSIRKTTIRRFCLFALLLSTFYSAMVVLVAFAVEDEVVDNLLSKEVNYVQRYYSKNGVVPEPYFDFVSYFDSLESLKSALPNGTEVQLNNTEIFVPGPKHYHLRIVLPNKNPLSKNQHTNSQNKSFFMLAEVGDLLSVSKLSAEISLLFVGVLILGLTLAVWQAYILASNTTKPISSLAKKVADLADNSASKHAKVRHQTNEVAYLSAIIESVFSNLEKTLIRERNFTQNVSHELRTPLTIFQNTLSLIKQRDWLATDKTTLSYAAEKMQSTIDTLLIMAREEGSQLGMIKIRPIIENSLLTHYQSLEIAKVETTVEVDDELVVSANADLVGLIVQNVLGNVVRHAPSCRLTISANSTNLVFRNTKSELTQDQPSDSIESDSGLGLLLIKRMAEQMQWQIQITDDDQQFKIVLLPG